VSSTLQGGTPLERLGREVLDKALMIAAFGVPLLSLLVLMNAIVHDTVSTMVIEVCAATLLFTVLWLVRKLLSFQTLAVSYWH
jgi:hypothetical protein